ncbi:hypothetical protein LZK98_11705 [Sphingomonas cannabina]|uniref:hypothetical protein n=1 Tax=Sphingomonas cannabina TaxID=2899123 RepID=UPI001F387967|nr:hypothetical protein [Sphingomonas cannabina]UIJ43756.1 hypothetical protein LZK98_11705 [Sphingomonas cannabina]
MADYRNSIAFQRSQRLRADGSPSWPITVADWPSLPEAHARVAQRQRMRRGLRLARAAGMVC